MVSAMSKAQQPSAVTEQVTVRPDQEMSDVPVIKNNRVPEYWKGQYDLDQSDVRSQLATDW